MTERRYQCEGVRRYGALQLVYRYAVLGIRFDPPGFWACSL